MTVFAQQVVNGLINGTVYALVALGLTLIYGVMNLSNFAQGEFAMVGGFGTYLLVQTGFPYPLAVVAAFLIAGAVGFVVHLLAFHPLRQNDPMTMMLSSLGVSLFLVNLAQYLFSPDPQVVHSPLSGQTLHLFGVYLSEQRLLAALVSLVLCGLVYGLLQYTSFGRSVRAASLDPDTATLYGIQTRKISVLTFVLGVALTGVAGALLAPLYNVYPTMGISLTLNAFAVVVLGGMGNVLGAIAGGLLVGLVQSLAAGYISSGFQDAIVFAVLIMVLIFRPQGILTKARGEKV